MPPEDTTPGAFVVGTGSVRSRGNIRYAGVCWTSATSTTGGRPAVCTAQPFDFLAGLRIEESARTDRWKETKGKVIDAALSGLVVASRSQTIDRVMSWVCPVVGPPVAIKADLGAGVWDSRFFQRIGLSVPEANRSIVFYDPVDAARTFSLSWTVALMGDLLLLGAVWSGIMLVIRVGFLGGAS